MRRKTAVNDLAPIEAANVPARTTDGERTRQNIIEIATDEFLPTRASAEPGSTKSPRG